MRVEVEGSLGVVEGGVRVLDGESGVEGESERVWGEGRRYGVLGIVFIKKMDKLGGKFDYCV
ncbi:GTP-binding protein, partial [Staphylococcus pasteuri]|uniref:GTP-binding protein n=1 Tax=Staphylococcus pasteuri TaxID=45972 RepID=UPI0021C1069B